MSPVPQKSAPTTNMRSLERAIDVLEILEDSRQALRLSEIARRAELHVATTQRILNVLEARGRVERDDLGYRAGVSLLFGAHAFLMTNPLVTSARPVLQDLAAVTGLAASLFVRKGWSRTAIARVEARPMRYELPIGERLPLHLGAGKVLAADMPEAELHQMLDEVGAIVTAAGHRIDRAAFLDELARIRQQGFSVAQNERMLGLNSVAAPVLGRDGGGVAAVQVSGTVEDLVPDRIGPLSTEVRRAADAITRQLP